MTDPLTNVVQYATNMQRTMKESLSSIRKMVGYLLLVMLE